MRWFDPEDGEQMEEALERLITELSDRKGSLGSPYAFAAPDLSPLVDLEETDDQIRLVAELPAVAPQELRILAQAATLTIEGRWGGDAPLSFGRSHLRETRRGAFRRVIELPGQVTGDGAHAFLENGILVVCLPKGSPTSGSSRTLIPLGQAKP